MSHSHVNQNVRQAVLAFADAGMLSEFWTGMSWDQDRWYNYLLPGGLRHQISTRSFSNNSSQLIRTYPWYEVGRFIANKLGVYRLSGGEGTFSPNSCHVALDKRVSRRIRELPELNAIYSYDHCALESFRCAGSRRIKRIYDLPIGYWRAFKTVCEEEIERNPEWWSTNPFSGMRQDVLSRKDEEISQADAIVVASKFTKRTLIEYMPEISDRIHVIPYGSPAVLSSITPNDRLSAKPNRNLRVLFVGLLGVAKGLPYLLDAIKKLGSSVELTLVGMTASRNCTVLSDALLSCRWIESLPHDQLLEEMRNHDVFVFPSVFDGFGLVVLEAMSQGLPVIVTPNAGASDVITDGVDGYIVPIRSGDAIAERLDVLNHDRGLLDEMRQAAIDKARVCSWEGYRSKLVQVVNHVIDRQV